MSEAGLSKDTPTSSATSQEPPMDSPTVASTSTGGGMFKKRAKTSSAQKGLRRPGVTQPAASTINISDDDSEGDDSDDEQGTRMSGVFAGRKRKRGGIIQASSTRKPAAKEDIGVSYDVSKRSEGGLDPKSQATAISAEFTEAELLGRTKSATPGESTSDNLYRGQKGYRSLVPQREQVTTKYNSMGPQKSSSNVRMTTVTDYAPGMFSLLFEFD
jgi:hypothetical protein